jgi:hypothetical protein
MYIDPTGQMMYLAVSLPIRQVEWDVEAGGDAPADAEAAEFVESVMNDMSQTWSDVIADVCQMFIFGFQVFWVVLKRRTERNSKFSDGRVGVRKLEYVAPAGIIDWEYAPDGDIVGPLVMNAKHQQILVPLSGSLYFRTTRSGDRVEGQSIYEAARRPWQYRRRLEQIEGVGLHRRWAGFPVVNLPRGASTPDSVMDGEVSDTQRGEELVQAVYEDRMMGAVLPDGWKLDFGGPEGNVDSTMGETVKRKDTEMARVILAQFLLQGLMSVGTQSLAETLLDAFSSAIQAFLVSIRDELNLYLVPILMRHNDFPGMTALPKITFADPSKKSVSAALQWIADLTGLDLTDESLTVKDLREAVNAWGDGSASEDGGGNAEGDPVQGVEEEAGAGADFSRYARLSGKLRTYSRPQTYRDLADGHGEAQRAGLESWTGDVAQSFEELGSGATEDEVGSKLNDLLLAGLLAFRERSVADIGAAFWLGFGAPSGPPEALAALSSEIETVDSWIGYGRGGQLVEMNPLGKPTLFGEIRGELEGQIAAIILLLKNRRYDEIIGVVDDAVRVATRSYSRAELYSGNVWHGVWAGVAAKHRLDPNSGPVYWVNDPFADHCHECPIFGAAPPGRRYDSMDALLRATGGVLPGYGTECDGNCRCHLADRTGAWL